MKLSTLTLIAACVIAFAACNSKPDSGTANNSLPANIHKVVTEDVIQASTYTYLKVKEDSKEEWLAVPLMVAKPGDTWYYAGGLTMTNFTSKELNKTFDNIIFLHKVSADPASVSEDKPVADNSTPPASPHEAMQNKGDAPTTGGEGYKRTSAPPDKKDVKVTAAAGGITIKELYANKQKYAGKTVKIRGEVTKYTPMVMNKNWIHIQDGTDADGKFDLTVTSDAETDLGKTITVEGKVSLDKDLGYGYFFDVIVEDAKIAK